MRFWNLHVSYQGGLARALAASIHRVDVDDNSSKSKPLTPLVEHWGLKKAFCAYVISNKILLAGPIILYIRYLLLLRVLYFMYFV